jgi:hypothetical protein
MALERGGYMSAISKRIRWWSCDADAPEIPCCDLDEAIQQWLEYSCDAGETVDESWPDPDATIEVVGYVVDTDAENYDPEATDEIPLRREVEGWVRASVWAKKFGLAYGPLYEKAEGA